MSHPLSARAFDRVIGPAMEREVSPLRQELLAGLHGRVLEVGAGNGLSFAHYPTSVTEVVALEPEPYLRQRAELAANAAPAPGHATASTTCTQTPGFTAPLAQLSVWLQRAGWGYTAESVGCAAGCCRLVDAHADVTG